jgi:leader peptidase (prepilin peptidase)/N-methyltransferase
MVFDDTAILVLSGVMGAMFGSFLNVVIHRLPERQSLVRPGSHCPHCETPIRFYDNLPVLSWLVLRGKCRHCGAGISLRYLGVELLTAGLTVLVAWLMLTRPDQPRWGMFFASVFLTYTLIPVTFIDLKLKIIPDRITKPGMVIAPVVSLMVPELYSLSPLKAAFYEIGDKPRVVALLICLSGMAAGAGAIWFMGALGRLLFKKDAMGLGDLKLMGFVGGFVGPVGVLMAILIGCVLGSVCGVVAYIFTRSSYIPFGPFLSAGTLLVLLWRPEIVHFFTVTYPGLFGG